MIKWIPIKKANAFVIKHHRHHKQVQGAIFALGLFEGIELIGVAITGRPNGRHLDDGLTAEVTRLCIAEGNRNACSKMYASCARICKEMGFHKIITFILESETGTSLKASGWICEDEKCGGKSWTSGRKRKRPDSVVDLFGTIKKYPNELKQRWSKILKPPNAQQNPQQ